MTLAQMTRDVNFFEMWKEILTAHPKMISDSPILQQIRGIVDGMADVLRRAVEAMVTPGFAETDVLRRIIENHGVNGILSMPKAFDRRFMVSRSVISRASRIGLVSKGL